LSVADCPEQIFAAFTEMAGDELTVTIIVELPLHPFELVPVTVYVVVPAGEALTLLPEVEDKPADGDQLYVLAPLACNAVD
jgi:hypothetical protein